MKQGRADRDGMGGVKREPISHAIPPAHAAEIGVKMADISYRAPDTSGRGFMAPAPASVTHHQSGSQGKHK